MDIDPRVVRALAEAAELPLPGDRIERLAPLLGSWLSGANELNRRMSAAEHLGVVPAAVFTHPNAQPGGHDGD